MRPSSKEYVKFIKGRREESERIAAEMIAELNEGEKGTMITEEQLDDMLHALGSSHSIDRGLMGWRNYYSVDEPHEGWEDLVCKGLAKRYDQHEGRIVYRVSAAGMKILRVTEKL